MPDKPKEKPAYLAQEQMEEEMNNDYLSALQNMSKTLIANTINIINKKLK